MVLRGIYLPTSRSSPTATSSAKRFSLLRQSNRAQSFAARRRIDAVSHHFLAVVGKTSTLERSTKMCSFTAFVSSQRCRVAAGKVFTERDVAGLGAVDEQRVRRRHDANQGFCAVAFAQAEADLAGVPRLYLRFDLVASPFTPACAILALASWTVELLQRMSRPRRLCNSRTGVCTMSNWPP